MLLIYKLKVNSHITRVIRMVFMSYQSGYNGSGLKDSFN